MISLFSLYDDSPLTIEDVCLLYRPMAEDIETLLPLPATVGFYSFDEGGVLPFIGNLSKGRGILQHRWDDAFAPVLLGSVLVIPVIHGHREGQVRVALTVEDADPALLGKMSASWLSDFQLDVIRRLVMVREIHTDPDTGMYNKRALRLVGHRAEVETSFFLFLSTGTSGKNAAGRMLNDRKSAGILRASSHGLHFSLGNGVYGILLLRSTSRTLEKFVRNLQRYLKRHGVSRAQVGIASAGRRETDMVEESWRCLGEAEKRGPFGICDSSALEYEPFSLPSQGLLKTLQGKWRGIPAFSLAVFKWSASAGNERCEREIIDYLQGRGECVGSEGNHTYVFFAETEASGAVPVVNGGEGLTAIHVEAVGIATWPCLRFSKIETVRSAMKALRHCSFLDPGAVVTFDHLSLNISGDVYFDLGDYHAAAREYRRGLQLEPHDHNLLNSLGVTLVEFNRHRAAMKCFQEVLYRHPNNTMALVNLGFSQQALGMKREAMSTLESAVGLMVDSTQGGMEILLPLSRLYIEFRRFKEAASLLEQWIGQHGGDRDFILFRLWALCCYELGRSEDAVKACQKALRLHPHDSISLSLLGLLYIKGGQGDDIGLRLCSQALEIDPLSSDNYLRLGQAMMYIKEYDEAIAAVKNCLQLETRHREGLLLLARIYLFQEKGKQAMRLLRRVMSDKQCAPDQYERAERLYAEAAGSK